MARQTIRVDAKITQITRLKNTYLGNPRYRIEFCDRDGASAIGLTKPNASFTYEIYSGMESGQYLITGHNVNLGSNNEPFLRITDLTAINA